MRWLPGEILRVTKQITFFNIMTTFHSQVQVEIAQNINLYAETLQCVW